MARKPLQPTPRGTLAAEQLALLEGVTAKRARTVIDHILEHGYITTDELRELYNYDHPPRAARDVREQGIPLVTGFISSDRTGRLIAAYSFDDPSNVKQGRIGGRVAFSKAFKEALLERYGSRDAVSGTRLESRYLQIDHRVPYEVGGDADEQRLADFMLLDTSSQRAKSWSCEHCRNFIELHDPAICATCLWASPESYEHVAMEGQRRMEVVWQGGEVAEFESITDRARAAGQTLQEYVKIQLRGEK